MKKKIIKRWEGRRKGQGWRRLYWYELYQDDWGYSFSGHNSAGNIGFVSLDKAMTYMQSLIDMEKMDGITLHEVVR